MRLLVLAAGLAASVALSACSQSSSEAQETAPVKPKDLGRSRMYYQGQDMIVKVDQATIEPGKAGDGIVLKASGVAAGPGYTDAQFLPRIYPAPPADGIYEVDVVATKPAAGAAAATPIEVKGDWTYYPKEHLKGVRFMSKTNAVVANLPASPPASGK
jgi:hypothetical protein